MSYQFKNHFRKCSTAYASYRPGYPTELFAYLASISPDRNVAWDCGTGNGQAALVLAHYFDQVIATDASAEQIANAVPHENVSYEVAAAEAAPLSANSIDLVVVAHALHWFDISQFFREAKRVLKSEGLIAVWAYKLFTVSNEIDKVIQHLYKDIVGRFWPKERRLVEQGYDSLDFPFKELLPPRFLMAADWSSNQLIQYMGTWSAVQRYKDAKGPDPIALVTDELCTLWGTAKKRVSWPLSLRVGVNSD